MHSLEIHFTDSSTVAKLENKFSQNKTKKKLQKNKHFILISKIKNKINKNQIPDFYKRKQFMFCVDKKRYAQQIYLLEYFNKNCSGHNTTELYCNGVDSSILSVDNNGDCLVAGVGDV